MKTNWPIKSLGEVANILGGYAFKSSELKKEKINDRYLPVIKIGNLLTSGVLEDTEIQFHEFEPGLSKYLIKEDDILIAMTGATVGKVAISNNKNLLLNQRVGLIRAKEALSKQDFLKYLLLSDSFYKYCQLTAGGGAQGNISPSQIMNYTIPIPSIHFQKKIVERLDAIRRAQELCDQQIQKTEELFESLVVTESKLLCGSSKKLKDITIKITKGTTPTTYGYSFTNNGIPFLRVEDIDNGELKFEETKYHISEETNNFMKRSQTNQGDVLITIAGTIGRVAVVPDDSPVLNMNQAVALIRLDSEVLSEFVKLVLMSDAVKSQILKSKVTGTLTNLSLTQLGNLEIPIPSIQDQKKIIEKLEGVQGYKKLLLKQKALLKELFDSVLDKSMKGEMEN